MILWATILFYLLAGLAAAQALATFGFVGALRRTRRVGRESPPCAKTAVILCLRGSDPFLADCLQGLLHQDYPCYDVRIVIDSPDDPAWGTVEQVVAHAAPRTSRSGRSPSDGPRAASSAAALCKRRPSWTTLTRSSP